MKNKTNRMYGKLATILLAVVLLTAGLSCMALAESENLLASLDPSFEADSRPSGLLFYGGASQKEGVAHEGTKSVQLTRVGALVRFYASVRPATNYVFSFWMQNSVAGSLAMEKDYQRFMVNGENMPTTTDGYHYDLSRFGDYTFGAELESDAISDWHKVTVNFTTPHYVDCVTLILSCVVEDASLLVDDAFLAETGKAPNRAFNGDFEALNEASTTVLPTGIEWQNVPETFLQEEAGNHYVKIPSNTSSTPWVKLGLGSFVKNTSSMGSRYKVSFKYKSASETVTPLVRFYNDSTYLNQVSRFPTPTPNTWETFTFYIDGTGIPSDLSARLWLGGRRINEDMYFDDVYSWYDENSIDFYKDLTFSYLESGSRYFTSVANSTAILTSEKSTEAESLSMLTADVDGYKTVKVRAHYVPTKNAQGTYDDETVMLFAGVYKYENGKKSLVDLYVEEVSSVVTDSVVEGKVLDVVADVKVPENTSTATYKVEAVAWEMDGMTPLMDKAVLE